MTNVFSNALVDCNELRSSGFEVCKNIDVAEKCAGFQKAVNPRGDGEFQRNRNNLASRSTRQPPLATMEYTPRRGREKFDDVRLLD